MKIASGFLYPAVIVFLLGGGVSARADLVSWTYNWDRNPAVLLAGTGGVTLTDDTGASAAGPSDIVATNIKVFSSAAAKTPDILSGGAYTLKLTLTDSASHASTLLTFTGVMSGTFSASSAHIVNSYTGVTTRTAILGGNSYTVTMGAYSPPGPPTASNSGSISAHVSVTPGHIHGTPEPSTMVMAGVGTGFIGLVSWRRRRARNLAAALA